MNTVAEQPRPFGPSGQQPLRQLRRRSRTKVLALGRWAAGHGISQRRVAGQVGVAQQTVNDWSQRRTVRQLDAVPRGRPVHVLNVAVKHEVEDLLCECHGRLGLPMLKHTFTDVPRTMLADLRRSYQAEHPRCLQHLSWTTGGRIWSADFTEPDLPVDGVYRYVLSVRDLASYQQLLSLPLRHADAVAAICALKYLFRAHDAPLVLKTDNGSGFIDDRVRRLLRSAGVAHLLSPPKTPRYNGSQEAGIGALKTRALHIAAAHGRPDQWTCDDVEAARVEGNVQSRPWGRNGPAPIDRWEARTPITGAERAQFQAAVQLARQKEQQQMIEQLREQTKQKPGFRPAPAAAGAAAGTMNKHQRATIARRAIRRVLVELGYLLVRSDANKSTLIASILTGN
jgi:transposase InsO family protein